VTEGLLIIFGCIVLFATAVWIWRNVKLYPCPECTSIDVEEERDIDGVPHWYCNECGKAWNGRQ
jgi:ribosomal protein L37AE/L43A